MTLRKRIRPLSISGLAIGLLAFCLSLAMPHLPIFAGLRGHGRVANGNWDRSGLDGGASRNNIYDRNYRELAVSYEVVSVYAKPFEVNEPEKVAEIAGRVLLRDAKELLKELHAGQSFVWLGRRLPREQAEQIAQFNLSGVYFVEESRRYYPNRQKAAHVLGFVKDGRGLAGIELFYDDLLGRAVGDRGARADESLQWGRQSEGHIVLSLDLRIQSLLERRLLELVEKNAASEAVGLVMSPDSGAVLGLVSYPSYDPNRFWEFDAEDRRNRALKASVYLGGMSSVFARIAAGLPVGWAEEVQAAAVDQANAPVAANVPKEPVILRPAMENRQEAVAEEGSLASFAGQLGLNDHAGIDLPAEETGGVGEAVAQKAFSLLDPFAETKAINLATALCRLANGGKTVTPHLLAEVWDSKGKNGVVPGASPSVAMMPPEFGRRFAEMIAGMPERYRKGDAVLFESVVEMGQAGANRAKVHPEDKEEKEAGRVQAVMMGLAPAGRPDVVMVVVLNNVMVDPAAVPAQFREKAEALVQQVQRLATVSLPKPPSPIAASEQGLQLPLDEEVDPADKDVPAPEPAGEARTAGRMPDVRGYSLRRALQVLQGHGMSVRADGAGKVVMQNPPAGNPLKGGQACTLRLDYEAAVK